MIAIDDLLTRLDGVKSAGDNSWTAHCPCTSNHAHGDRNSSLSVKYDPTTRKILLYCHTGCSIDEICAALGIKPGDLSPDPAGADKREEFLKWYAGQNGMSLEAVYSYCYGQFADGLAKVRFRKADGKKDFRWIKNDPGQRSGFKMTHEGCPNRLYFAGDPTKSPVFIVEGEKDADTMHRLTGCTAASTENGASKSQGGKWRDEYTQQLEGKSVYILWDNDEIGKRFAEVEAHALEGHAAHIFMLDLAGAWPDCPEKGDVSDMAAALGADPARKILNELVHNAAERPQTEEQQPPKTPVQLFDEFMAKIQTDTYKPLKTGLPAFDRLLGGGIIRQSLVILSAAPGTGKTTLTQQIFELMAGTGTDVIFLNLEMSREQLLARSLSRQAYLNGHKDISAADILKGYAWDETQREVIREVADDYRKHVAPRMQYNPENCRADLDSILNSLNAAGEAAKQENKPAPVVVVDYLHLITSEKREEAGELLKRAVQGFKDYAKDYDTFVFAISANNRAANSSGIVSLESGRDTSALEYSADILLGLNYAALAEKRKKPDSTQTYDAGNPEDMAILQKGDANGNREMIVQVLKSRMDRAGGKLRMAFNPGGSVFLPIVDKPGRYAGYREESEIPMI